MGRKGQGWQERERFQTDRLPRGIAPIDSNLMVQEREFEDLVKRPAGRQETSKPGRSGDGVRRTEYPQGRFPAADSTVGSEGSGFVWWHLGWRHTCRRPRQGNGGDGPAASLACARGPTSCTRSTGAAGAHGSSGFDAWAFDGSMQRRSSGRIGTDGAKASSSSSSAGRQPGLTLVAAQMFPLWVQHGVPYRGYLLCFSIMGGLRQTSYKSRSTSH